MIHLVDKTLEQFLRREVPLSERAVDVSFQPPDKTWGAGLTRPTVNLFLWDVSRAQNRTRAGMEQRVAPSGVIERRPATPVVAVHYLVTAWASELRDEHQLLGSVLDCVMRNGSIPADLVPEDMAVAKWALSLATEDRRLPNEFWSSLGGTLKPGLQVQVILPVEVFAWQPAAPGVEQISVDVSDLDSIEPDPREADAEIPAPLTRRRANGAMVMEGTKATEPANTSEAARPAKASQA